MYLPNFKKLGCQVHSTIKWDMESKAEEKLNIYQIKNAPQTIFYNYHNRRLNGIFIAKDYLTLQKLFKRFREDNKGLIKEGQKQNIFFYELDEIEHFRFSAFLNNILGLENTILCRRHKLSDGEIVGLNNNEKRVLHALVRYPELSSAEIAKKIWISKPTVIKIKRKLIQEQIIVPFVLPNLVKFGINYLAEITMTFEGHLPRSLSKIDPEPQTFQRIISTNKLHCILFFRTKEEFVGSLDKIKKKYQKFNLYFDVDYELFSLQKQYLMQRFSSEPLVRELLFE